MFSLLKGEGISYVPKGRQIFSDLTVKENLEMGAFVMQDKELINLNIKNIYDKFPVLYKKRNVLADKLSGGQQQLLAIARALVQNPQLLLLDEPSLGLSPKATKEIFELIKKINKEGVTIILVEQNVKTALKYTNQVIVLLNGEIALKSKCDKISLKDLEQYYF